MVVKIISMLGLLLVNRVGGLDLAEIGLLLLKLSWPFFGFTELV